ncbi:MAG: glycosyl transferase family 1 [Ignavibacteriales bacterium]|nr:glycosyl transferase family 1 [Ignavibacteriales bacterium]
MFRVLVISYYFPPMGMGGVQRTLRFVKYMKNFNWEPTVITTGATNYYAHDPVLLEEIITNNLRVIRTDPLNSDFLFAKNKTYKMKPEFLRKFISRVIKTIFIPDNKKSWSKKAFAIAKNLLEKEKFDIIFVSIPPFSSFNIAAKLSQMFDISLFVDYRELWTHNQFSFNLTPYHKYLHKKMEYGALKVADKIITVNRKIKEKLLSTFQFLTFDDVLILPEGYDLEDFANITRESKLNNKLRLTYAGMFYEFITPKYFLKAFKELTIERPDVAENIELHFIGYLLKENHKLIKKLGLIPYVKDFGYIDHKSTIIKLLSSDVLWMMIGNSKNSDTLSTSKLFEYFGTRKPIIGCVPEGAARSSLQEYGASFITEPNNIQQIKETIIQVHKLYREGNLPKPNEEFVEKHRGDYLTEQLTKQFQFYLREI